MGTEEIKITYERMVEGARHYAAFDKSDPFTFARCMTHIRQRLCRPVEDGGDGHYSAHATTEPAVTADGREYQRTIYHFVRRP